MEGGCSVHEELGCLRVPWVTKDKVFVPDWSSESLWTINKTLVLWSRSSSTSKIKVQNDMLKQVISSIPSSFKFYDLMHSHILCVMLEYTKNIRRTDLWIDF